MEFLSPTSVVETGRVTTVTVNESRRRGGRPRTTGRLSPPTARAMAVLGHLARQPDRALGLSEIAEQTGISTSTCLGIVNEFVVGGFLVVDDTKGYCLGPAALALGAAAAAGPGLEAVARPHLRRLSHDMERYCTTSRLLGDDIVVVDAAGDDRWGSNVRVGLRYPCRAPTGIVLVAWLTDAAVEAWLDQAHPSLQAVDRRRIRKVVDDCRARGFAVERVSDEIVRAYALLASVPEGTIPEELVSSFHQMVASIVSDRHFTGPIRPEQRYPVNMITAPVFGATGVPVLNLAVYVGEPAMAGRDLRGIADALVRTCTTVTTEIGGYSPWDSG